MNYPISISPCPIVEAIFELKFETQIPYQAILGIVFNQFQDEYPILENLLTSQIPEELKINDPNFKFKAYHQLSNDDYTIMIGYDVIAISIKNEYKGWKKFKPRILSFIDKIKKIGLVKTPVSGILRYMNFFSLDIYPQTNLAITLNDSIVDSFSSQVRFETKEQEFVKILQVANNVIINNRNIHQKEGSIIDVSVVTNDPYIIVENTDEIIERMHLLEKETFFGLLKPSFLSILSPVY